MYKTIFISLVVLIEVLGASNIDSLSAYESNNDYMKLLNISQSDESKDYIFNKTQFQLSNLTTEQIHYKTKNLSFTDSITDGLLELLSVDQDITNRINSLKRDEIEKLEDLKENIKEMIMTEGRVYVYGTGSTGRLAKQVENIWRRFWNKFNIKDLEGIKDKLSNFFPNFDKMQDKFIGDITGGDRALIKSLEGFEDLQIIGKLQLLDYNITSKDMVLTFTEGGETSAVIGCALAASEIIQNKNKVYFFYNNPDEILINFDRSKSVLLNDKITKINFTTGPQAITGSTRMQATSSQTFLISCVIEQALSEVLSEILDKEEIYYMGFSEKPSIIESLNNFETLRLTVEDNIKKLGNLAQIEYSSYLNNSTCIYYGNELISTLFIDVTERAPTFSLDALDSKFDKTKKSWIQITTKGDNSDEAWFNLLLREFRGLDQNKYLKEFENIEDPYLRSVALNSLKNADFSQKLLYDFSSNTIGYNHTIGIAYITIDELVEISLGNSPLRKWIDKFKSLRLVLVVISIDTEKNQKIITYYKNHIRQFLNIELYDFLIKDSRNQKENISDPMKIKHVITLKLILNSQSTLIMSKLNRVFGNSMLYVTPSNLKLIGRATYLMQIHINQILSECRLTFPLITYEEANAILFDAKKFFDSKGILSPIIPVSMVRIFESLKGEPKDWSASLDLLHKYNNLNNYIRIRLKC